MMTADNIIKKAHCSNAVVKGDNNTTVSQKEVATFENFGYNTNMCGEPGRCLKIFILLIKPKELAIL